MSFPKLRPYLPETKAFAKGHSSPSHYLQACIEAIEEWEANVKAFVVLDIEDAREQAKHSSERWRAARPLSPIDGMPIGVKDIMETARLPTAEGSSLFTGRRTGRDAAMVAALRAAGAIILGKTVTTEFAATTPGPTTNPWDHTRTPGGSSSGSAAAVGCGMIPVGLGTQVIGSTIRPAAYCGCFGFKPSVNALNRGGSFDNKSQSASAVLAASLEECWVVARQVALRTGGDSGHIGLTGPHHAPEPRRPSRIALLQTAGWNGADDACKAIVSRAAAACRSAGIDVIDRTNSDAAEAVELAIDAAQALSTEINTWEDYWPLNTYAIDLGDDNLSEAMRHRLAAGRHMTQDQYGRALARREDVRGVFETLSRSVDFCLTLSAPSVAPRGLASTGDPIFAVPASLLGTPSISLPIDLVENLPVGLQFIGFRDRDAELFAHTAFVHPLLI